MVLASTYTFTERVKRGSALENIAESLLTNVCGFDVIPQYKTGTYSSIDGCRIKADGYVTSNEKWPDGMLYECKSQDVGGSAYKKLPTYVIDAQHGVYPAPLIMIVDGDFFANQKPGIAMMQWLKSQVDGKYLVGVMNSQEFITWAQRSQCSIKDIPQ